MDIFISREAKRTKWWCVLVSILSCVSVYVCVCVCMCVSECVRVCFGCLWIRSPCQDAVSNLVCVPRWTVLTWILTGSDPLFHLPCLPSIPPIADMGLLSRLLFILLHDWNYISLMNNSENLTHLDHWLWYMCSVWDMVNIWEIACSPFSLWVTSVFSAVTLFLLTFIWTPRTGSGVAVCHLSPLLSSLGLYLIHS